MRFSPRPIIVGGMLQTGMKLHVVRRPTPVLLN